MRVGVEVTGADFSKGQSIKKKKEKKLHGFLNVDGIKIKVAIFPKYCFLCSVEIKLQ